MECIVDKEEYMQRQVTNVGVVTEKTATLNINEKRMWVNGTVRTDKAHQTKTETKRRQKCINEDTCSRRSYITRLGAISVRGKKSEEIRNMAL